MLRNYKIEGKGNHTRFAYSLLQEAARQERFGNRQKANNLRSHAAESLRKESTCS